MDILSPNTLVTLFGIFIFLLMILVLFLRKISVDDLLTPPPATRKPIIQRSGAPISAQSPTPSSASAFPRPTPAATNNTNPGGGLTREKLNLIAKIVGGLGLVLLFAPLPKTFSSIGTGMAFLGYLVAKASAPPKKKTTQKTK
jgi:hypothetical protein